MFGSRIGTVEFFCIIEKHLEFLEGMLKLHGEERQEGLGSKARSVCGQTISFWVYHRHFTPSTPWTDLRNTTLFQSSPLPWFLCKWMIPQSLNLDKPESYKFSFLSLSLLHPFIQVPLILSHKYFCLLFLLPTQQHLCWNYPKLKFSCCPICSVLFPAVERVRRLMCPSSA